MLNILLLVIVVAGREREVIPAHLSEFSFAWSGAGKHFFDGPEDAWRILRCVDSVGMLVEAYVASNVAMIIAATNVRKRQVCCQDGWGIEVAT